MFSLGRDRHSRAELDFGGSETLDGPRDILYVGMARGTMFHFPGFVPNWVFNSPIVAVAPRAVLSQRNVETIKGKVQMGSKAKCGIWNVES